LFFLRYESAEAESFALRDKDATPSEADFRETMNNNESDITIPQEVENVF
jgi:hypothetical protein